MFELILTLLLIGAILILIQRIKFSEKEYLMWIGSLLILLGLLLLPFYDPLLVSGFLASMILDTSKPSTYGVITGFVVINCSMYGINIWISSLNLKYGERYRGKLIYTGQFAKRRHPMLASYTIMGLGYGILMGSITSVIIMSIVMIYLHFLAGWKEKKKLIPRYGKEYEGYQQNVLSKIFSFDIIMILLIEYALFIFGLLLF